MVMAAENLSDRHIEWLLLWEMQLDHDILTVRSTKKADEILSHFDPWWKKNLRIVILVTMQRQTSPRLDQLSAPSPPSMMTPGSSSSMPTPPTASSSSSVLSSNLWNYIMKHRSVRNLFKGLISYDVEKKDKG